jgi:cellulose synthase/poly-beta-1,6-N-acetylglucosamine synthase-like glycosyltransferase
VYHERNEGRGKSFYDGAAVARGDIIGFVDIDLEVHERFIPDMVRAIQDGADVATGRRRIKFSFRPYGLLRHAMSIGYAVLYRQLLRLPTRDPETGFKFFRKDALTKLFQHANAAGWFWDSQAMAYSTLLGFRVEEVPCEFVRRGDKQSSVKLFRATIQQTRELIGFALLLRRQRRKARSRANLHVYVQQPSASATSFSVAAKHGDRLPVGGFVEVVRGRVVARELPEALRIEPRLEAASPGIRQQSRDSSDRRERV